MISAGMSAFLLKGVLGNFIDRTCFNYLGQRRGFFVQVLIYCGAFFFSFSWMNRTPRLNVNHLINARDFNGEIMMNVVLKYFPQKVNQDRFRQVLMEKYEG